MVNNLLSSFYFSIFWVFHSPYCARWCKMVQHGATWCNVVQHVATWCNVVQHDATWCNMVQDGARCCKMVQDGAKWCKMVPNCAKLCKIVQDGANSATISSKRRQIWTHTWSIIQAKSLFIANSATIISNRRQMWRRTWSIIQAKSLFYCKQCNYYFKSATDMMAHMIDHSGEKPLNCKKNPYSSATILPK